MYQSFIIVPDNYCPSKGKLPRGYQTFLQLSKKLKAPILKHELLEKLADGCVSTFPSELKENLWQHPDVKDYVISPPPVQMCFDNLWGANQAMERRKNKQFTYQTNDHVAQEVVIICTLVAHIDSTVCNHIAYRKCIKCTRLLRKFPPIPQFSKRARYALLGNQNFRHFVFRNYLPVRP